MGCKATVAGADIGVIDGGAPDSGGTVLTPPAVERAWCVADEGDAGESGMESVGVGNKAGAKPGGVGGKIAEQREVGRRTFGRFRRPEKPPLIPDLNSRNVVGGSKAERVAQEVGGVGGGIRERGLPVKSLAEVDHEERSPAQPSGEGEKLAKTKAGGSGVAEMAASECGAGTTRKIGKVAPVGVVGVGACGEANERGAEFCEGCLHGPGEPAVVVADGLGAELTVPRRAFEELAKEA
jgi:hypothetical protein